MAEDLEAQLSGMSAKELKKYADEKGIDTGGAKQKKKLIEAILKASPAQSGEAGKEEPVAEPPQAPSEGATPADSETPPAQDKPAEPSAEPEPAPAQAEKPADVPEPEPAEPAFDEAEFEKSLKGINTELEQIGTHITSTLGKLAGIDEITTEELRTIDESILSTSFVEVDFEEPRTQLREAKRLHDTRDWRKSFKASSEAIRGMERQAKGFRRVAYARAIEACEKSLSGLERGTEGLATAQHELLHAKLLFSRDDERRMLESLARLDQAVSALPEPTTPSSDMHGGAEASEASQPQSAESHAFQPPSAEGQAQEQPASARRGRCKNCQSTDIEFFENGTARCRGCGRMFVWRKPQQKKGFFDRVFGSK